MLGLLHRVAAASWGCYVHVLKVVQLQAHVLVVLSPSALSAGRNIALKLAKAGKEWKAAASVRMPEARGDIREIIGQPVFVPLQKLAIIYGKAGISTTTSNGYHID